MMEEVGWALRQRGSFRLYTWPCPWVVQISWLGCGKDAAGMIDSWKKALLWINWLHGC